MANCFKSSSFYIPCLNISKFNYYINVINFILLFGDSYFLRKTSDVIKVI